MGGILRPNLTLRCLHLDRALETVFVFSGACTLEDGEPQPFSNLLSQISTPLTVLGCVHSTEQRLLGTKKEERKGSVRLRGCVDGFCRWLMM